MFEYEWSHIAQIATIDSGDSISFTIFVERIEVDPITEVETRTKLDVTYEPIINEPQRLEELPETVSVSDDGVEVIMSGIVNAQAEFIDMAYSVDGDSRTVQNISDIPSGAKVHKLIPSSEEYKYYMWKVFANDAEDDDFLVERTFTLKARITWDAANKTIKKLASEIV
jgi:hypothetical protein